MNILDVGLLRIIKMMKIEKVAVLRVVSFRLYIDDLQRIPFFSTQSLVVWL
jgi:hypothetical protein